MRLAVSFHSKFRQRRRHL